MKEQKMNSKISKQVRAVYSPMVQVVVGETLRRRSACYRETFRVCSGQWMGRSRVRWCLTTAIKHDPSAARAVRVLVSEWVAYFKKFGA